MIMNASTKKSVLHTLVKKAGSLLKSLCNNGVGFSGNHYMNTAFRVIVFKEVSDQVRSWRFIILMAIIALTCFGSLYAALSVIDKAIKPNDPEGSFFFLKLFTLSDGTLPSYAVYISFLGPLLGISLGFDAINSEHNRGTLSRLLANPIHRDYILNAKFLGSLIVISVLLFVLGFLVMGIGLIAIGIPPTVEEFMRIIAFILLSIVYVAFWLNLSIYFSVRFRQPATSALSGIAIWLFFSVFYPMIINMVSKVFQPSEFASAHEIAGYERMISVMLYLLPNQLFSAATSTLLMPSIRSLGTLTMEQMTGALPGPLPIGQSLMLVWAQVTALIAATVFCFVLSYVAFMRKEIRSR
jgi:ABC-2 type transport system permease protein